MGNKKNECVGKSGTDYAQVRKVRCKKVWKSSESRVLPVGR
jgi:hypothetical protein